MRITIIELSPEELNVIGMAEELPEVSDKSNPGHPKKYPSSLRYAVASPTPGEAGGAVSNDCDGNFLGNVRLFGQKLWSEGNATLRDLVTLTMEHFCLSTADFARIIGANPSTVSLFLNHGQCLEAVLVACTNFFGYGGSPKSTQRPAKPGEQSQLVTAEHRKDGTTATATFGGR